MTYSPARWEAVMAPNYPTPAIQLEKGQGATVWDSEGRVYTDLLAGIAVNILGHAHPALVRAVSTQVALLAHTSNLYANAPNMRLAERLQARTHAGHKVIFQNSGTEANEAALKLVRRHAHAKGMPDAVVVAFHNSFHGRTSGAVKLTGQAHYQEGFTPLPEQVVHVPFNDPAVLEQAFAQHKVAGVFFEAVQGEGGVLPITKDAAATMARLCKQHDAVLVADEIQTGVGRTGRFFGYEHDGLEPDVVTLAKGLGGGLPIGAALIHPKFAPLLPSGAHGTTFGGNAVCCAAGNAVLDVLEQDGLVARAQALGRTFTNALGEAGLQARGRGLLLGVPLPGPQAPDVVKAMREAGYLVGQAGKTVVRIAPPLTISEKQLVGAVPHLAKAVQALPAASPA
ncbi:MAG: acetylornithine/N-succinyldiaminopimelate aminotransferase [Thermoplasmata archaeon]|jgi:acetylornithine aminotransferase|nr:acetylornithine/N-succinyldiaminopimelate aminotransferase [Thermoplasmata archaeon]